jgi:hypothetical protein
MKIRRSEDASAAGQSPRQGTLGRRRFLKQTGKGLLLVTLSPVLSRCGTGSPGDGPVPAADFCFAVLSDTHILKEKDAMQNKIFGLTVEILNAFSPAIDFVLTTGDVVDYLPSDDPAYYPENDTALNRLAEMSAGLRMPLHLVLGNHDYYTGGEILHVLTEKTAARELLYQERMGMPAPYYAFEHRGVKFYCLNSMQQDPAVEWHPNAVGTFGADQVAWLRSGLADGKPAFLFHHHPLATELTTTAGWSAFIPFEVPRADGHFRKYRGTPLENYTDPIYELLRSHEGQIRADFFGHSHLFLRDGYEGTPLYMTDSMQFPSSAEYDGKPMRFHIVECEADTGNFTIYNAYMIHYWKEDSGSADRTPARVLDPALFL